MGHHLVWTTHELFLGINTPKKCRSISRWFMINTTIQCWLIVTHFHGEYICFDCHSQNPSHTFPHEKPWVCLRSLKKNPQVADFPWAKTKTSSSNPGKSLMRYPHHWYLQGVNTWPQMWRRRLNPSACGWFLHGTVNPSGLVPLRSLTQRRSFSYREKTSGYTREN